MQHKDILNLLLFLNIHNDVTCSMSNICHFQPPLHLQTWTLAFSSLALRSISNWIKVELLRVVTCLIKPFIGFLSFPVPLAHCATSVSWNPSQEVNCRWILVSGSASGGTWTVTPGILCPKHQSLQNHQKEHWAKCIQSLKTCLMPSHACSLSWALFH